MLNFHQYIAERFVPNVVKKKQQWGVLMSTERKKEFGDELIKTVQNAYSKTDMGSFVNSLKDVLPSDWLAIDTDDDPEIDGTIFYRKNRPNETWTGFKIQGLGHDGTTEAKQKILTKKYALLKKKGWWIESSGATEHLSYKNNVKYIEDEKFLQKLFPNSELKMIGDRGKYTRKVAGKTVTETVFGNPILRKNSAT